MKTFPVGIPCRGTRELCYAITTCIRHFPQAKDFFPSMILRLSDCARTVHLRAHRGGAFCKTYEYRIHKRTACDKGQSAGGWTAVCGEDLLQFEMDTPNVPFYKIDARLAPADFPRVMHPRARKLAIVIPWTDVPPDRFRWVAVVGTGHSAP